MNTDLNNEYWFELLENEIGRTPQEEIVYEVEFPVESLNVIGGKCLFTLDRKTAEELRDSINKCLEEDIK